jgi:hypothetical protein
MWTLANPIKHAANEKGLVTNIDSNNLVPSFVGVDARMHILCDCDRIFVGFPNIAEAWGKASSFKRLWF